MDTEKQRQRRRNDTRLTESGNTTSEKLLAMPTEWIGTSKAWQLWNIRLVFVRQWIRSKRNFKFLNM